MKARLIKEAGGYDLYRIDENGKRVTFASTQDYKQKLSLKNCQAIERGYDLDKLADEYIIIKPNYRDHEHNMRVSAFKMGFQKALEILGDKKFSINEVVELCKILMSNPFEKCGKTYQELTDNYIQSLQQTEWNVELVMDRIPADRAPEGWEVFPKLDADGCLILKLKL